MCRWFDSTRHHTSSKKRPLLINRLHFNILFIFLIILLVGNDTYLHAQQFDFLKLPTNAHVNGLGGVTTSSLQKDINTINSNPALLSDSVNCFSFTHAPFLAGLFLSSVQAGIHFSKIGLWGVGMHYLNYGKIEGYDDTGAPIGSFYANDYALTVTHSHTVESYTVGATLKLAGSSFIYHQAWAMLFDIGTIYKHPTKELQLGLVFKNIGMILQKYTATSSASIPFDVQMGITTHPSHMPFRLSITLHQLSRIDNPYFSTILGKFASHCILSGEILMSKNLTIQTGYNISKRKELQSDTSPLAGFSIGAVLATKRIQMGISHSFFQTKGLTSFTLSLCLTKPPHKAAVAND